MVNRGNTKMGCLKAYPCGIYGLRVKPNSVVCAQCDKWFHSKYAGVKLVQPKCSRILYAVNVQERMEAVDQWNVM